MANLFDLSGRVAVVVGATSGIGRAIAIGLAEHGADVIPTGRRTDAVENACGEIEAFGRRTLRIATDISSRASIDALRDHVLRELGHVDILVNAAGYTFRKPTVQIDESEWAALINTNLTGYLRSCQAFYEPLKASGR